MAGIFFGSAGGWMVPDWIYRRLLDGALLAADGDDELTLELQGAKGSGGLTVEQLDAEVIARALPLFRSVVAQDIDGRHGDLDDARRTSYLQALPGLVHLMDQYEWRGQ